MEDKIYLLEKKQFELKNQLSYFTEKKQFYENMIHQMNNHEIKNTQERFLLSDLQRLICFFENKIDIIQIKLKDVNIIFD
jgi:hypothetical protein